MNQILQVGRMFNCYLILGDSCSVLVDTGTASVRSKIYNAVKDKNVQLIVLTHGHIDHIANAAYLAEKLNVPISMHKADYSIVQNPSSRTLFADHFIGKMIRWMSGKMASSSPFEPFEPSLYLKQGMSLKPYGVSGEICELPGHTAGSIGIIVNGDTLIAGDAMMNMFGSPESKLFEDKEMMRRSIETIQKMPLSKIYVGHGKMLKQ